MLRFIKAFKHYYKLGALKVAKASYKVSSNHVETMKKDNQEPSSLRSGSKETIINNETFILQVRVIFRVVN